MSLTKAQKRVLESLAARQAEVGGSWVRMATSTYQLLWKRGFIVDVPQSCGCVRITEAGLSAIKAGGAA